MMKTLTVRRLSKAPAVAETVGYMMDEAQIGWQPLDCANWSDQFSYKPHVDFRIAHTGNFVLLQYRVEEETVRALATADGGPVWKDSCCEFFIYDEESQLYNNIECNCAATLLMAVGKERNGRIPLSHSDMQQVGRWSSLGTARREVMPGPFSWTLVLKVPVALLFDHRLSGIGGLLFRANVYKCGDSLPHPHFLSWNPVDIPQPDFHRPDYFGQLYFET